MGSGVFLRSRVPCPGMVTGLRVDKKGGRVENAAGGHYCSSGPSVTLRLLSLGGASEELRGDKPREARAALGGAWLVWSEGGARRAGERQGTRKMLKMALGSGGTEGREETVAAMTAASGCARPAPGPSPHPPSPFWIIPMPVKTGSPEASFFVFVLFEKSAQRMLRMRDGQIVREGVGMGEGEWRILLAGSASPNLTFDPSLWDLMPGQSVLQRQTYLSLPTTSFAVSALFSIPHRTLAGFLQTQ